MNVAKLVNEHNEHIEAKATKCKQYSDAKAAKYKQYSDTQATF